MIKLLIAATLGLGAGIVSQYFMDAQLVRGALHVKPWSLYHNITEEARFRQQAIDYLRKGG